MAIGSRHRVPTARHSWRGPGARLFGMEVIRKGLVATSTTELARARPSADRPARSHLFRAREAALPTARRVIHAADLPCPRHWPWNRRRRPDAIARLVDFSLP